MGDWLAVDRNLGGVPARNFEDDGGAGEEDNGWRCFLLGSTPPFSGFNLDSRCYGMQLQYPTP